MKYVIGQLCCINDACIVNHPVVTAQSTMPISTPDVEQVILGIRSDGTQMVSADFARKLERERDQWRQCADELAESCMRKGWAMEKLVAINKALTAYQQLKESTK